METTNFPQNVYFSTMLWVFHGKDKKIVCLSFSVKNMYSVKI